MDLHQVSQRLGIGWSDAAWAVGLLAAGQWNLWADWESYFADSPPHLAINTVTVSVATLVLLFRRRAPVVAVFVTGLALFVPDLVVATGPVFWGEWVPLLVASYSLASQVDRSRVVAFGLPLVLAVFGWLVLSWRHPEALWNLPGAVTWLGPTGLAVGAGAVIGRLRDNSRLLADHAEEVERCRQQDAEQAVERERARIARELHDVIAHSVSVMVVQASAAENVLDSDPAGARTALRHVQASGREALEEMKLLLGVLRNNGDNGDNGSRTPVPSLRRLDTLVESVQRSGLRVQLELRGVEHRLPPSADVAAYRVIQEALTNALRYAPGATVRVDVDVAPSSLRIEVHDDGVAHLRPSGAGQGLLGLRERLSLHGGSLQAGPDPEGGFTVCAELPLKSGLVPG
jgi:signal transduction histidine kinase